MIACKSEIQKSTVFPCISSRKQKKTTLSKTREKTLNNPPKNTPALTWRVRGLYGADRATAERRRREAGRRRPEAPAPRGRRCPQSHRDVGVGPAWPAVPKATETSASARPGPLSPKPPRHRCRPGPVSTALFRGTCPADRLLRGNHTPEQGVGTGGDRAGCWRGGETEPPPGWLLDRPPSTERAPEQTGPTCDWGARAGFTRNGCQTGRLTPPGCPTRNSA